MLVGSSHSVTCNCTDLLVNLAVLLRPLRALKLFVLVKPGACTPVITQLFHLVLLAPKLKRVGKNDHTQHHALQTTVHLYF